MKYKAIIFDLDGTLLDSLKDLAMSVNLVLKQNGLKEHPINAYRYLIGDGVDYLVKKAFPDEWVNEKGSLDYYVKKVKKEYSQRWANYTKPYPGIPELLTKLEEWSIPKAIFTNKPHEFAKMIEKKLLSQWFFFDVCGIREGIPLKPDPTGALNIALKMQIETKKIVYLGDTSTDMKTALAGGFLPVGALWGFRNADELLQAGAAKIATTPCEIKELF